MAVIIHYINKFYKIRTRLIAIRRVYGGHSRENQAKFLIKILKEFELTDLLGYFIFNNMISNDSCIDYLFRIFKSDFSVDDRIERRLRYYDYILNLAVNVYLWGKDSFFFDREIIINNIL